MKKNQEIYCDLNSMMTDKDYRLVTGSMRDLEKTGLTLEQAKGKKFTFYMDDADDDGTPNDIMFDGTIVSSAEYKYSIERQSDFYWRNDKKNTL